MGVSYHILIVPVDSKYKPEKEKVIEIIKHFSSVGFFKKGILNPWPFEGEISWRLEHIFEWDSIYKESKIFKDIHKKESLDELIKFLHQLPISKEEEFNVRFTQINRKIIKKMIEYDTPFYGMDITVGHKKYPGLYYGEKETIFLISFNFGKGGRLPKDNDRLFKKILLELSKILNTDLKLELSPY